MTEAADRYPSPEAIRRFVRSLGPSTIPDLFAGYGVAEEDGAVLLEETLALLAVERREIEDLRLWFLETLEERCQIYVERRQAEEAEEEAQDEGPAPDA